MLLRLAVGGLAFRYVCFQRNAMTRSKSRGEAWATRVNTKTKGKKCEATAELIYTLKQYCLKMNNPEIRTAILFGVKNLSHDKVMASWIKSLITSEAKRSRLSEFVVNFAILALAFAVLSLGFAVLVVFFRLL